MGIRKQLYSDTKEESGFYGIYIIVDEEATIVVTRGR